MKIQNTNELDATTLSFVIAAEAGNGKTTLAQTIEKAVNEKVLVISAEAGLLSIQGSGIGFVELQKQWDEAAKGWASIPKTARIQRLVDIYNWLMLPDTQAKYKWIFVDSLTEINQNMLEFIESLEDFQGPKNTIKKYGELSTRMMSLCKTFRDMPHYNKVFSALVKSEADADGVPKMKIAMVGSFADRLPALFDEIFYLGVMKDVGEDGRNIRMLLTQKTDRIEFPKDRSGKLDRSEPADLGSIINKIRKPALVADISTKAKAAAKEAKAMKVEEKKPEVANAAVG